MAMTVAELQVVVDADTSKAESGLSGLGSKLGGIGGMVGTAFGGAALAGIAALGAGLTASVSAAATFEQAMSGIKAVSGATGEEMQTLSGLAMDLGASTSFSASEAAAGIGELIKAGVSIGDVMGGGAAAALSLAAAGGIEVAEAAEIASNAMNVFGMSGAEMAHVADTIAGAANASAIDVTDFKQSLAASGAVAATVGIGFDDLSTAIAVMGQAGIKGSDAGTSLKTMMLNLSPSTKPAIAAMKDLGIITADGSNQFFDATGKAKSFSEIAGVLQHATADLTEEQKINALQTIFGTDAIRAAAVMAKQGSEGFDTMAESIGKVSAADVAKTRLDNLKGSMEALGGSLETAGIMIGNALLPGLKGMADTATVWVNKSIDIIKQLPGAWEDVKTLFSEGSTGGNFEKMLSDLGLSEAMVVQVDEWTVRMGDSWRTMQQALAGEWSPSNQIDPFVNSVGIATTALVTLRDTVVDAFDKAGRMGAWDNLRAGFDTLGSTVKMAGDRFNDIGAAFDRAMKASGSTATASDVLAAAIKGLAVGFQLTALQIAGFVDQVLTGIAVTIDFATAASRVGDAFQKLGKGDIQGAMTSLGQAKEAFGSATQAAEDLRVRGLERSAEGMKIVSDAVKTHIPPSRAAIESNMKAAEASVAEGSSGMQRFMEANLGDMQSTTESGMEGVASAAESGMDGVASAVETGASTAASSLESATSEMQTTTEAGMQGVAGAAEAASPEFVSAVQAMGDLGVAALDTSGAAMAISAETGMQGVATAAESASPEFVSAVQGMGDAGVAALDAAGPLMAASAGSGAASAVAAVQAQQGPASGAGQSIGDAIGSGLEGGISGWVGRVAAAAANVVTTAINSARAAADAHSPSKKTQQLAEDLMVPIEQRISQSTLSSDMKAQMNQFIVAVREYVPVAKEIGRVEAEIAAIREQAQTAALFRAEEMITVDSEVLHLKKEQAVAERDLIPLRQELAAADREVQEIERGTLVQRERLLTLEGEQGKRKLESLSWEYELLGIAQQREAQQERVSEAERGYAELQQRFQRDELERSRELTNLDDKALRLRKEMAQAEKALLPIRQQLAKAAERASDIQRGSLDEQKDLIKLDGEHAKIRLQQIAAEEKLAKLAEDDPRAAGIKAQLEALGKQDQALSLQADRIRTTNEIASVSARLRQAELEEQVRRQEQSNQGTKNQSELLQAQRAVVEANAAITKAGHDQELKSRQALVDAIKLEGKATDDRIRAIETQIKKLDDQNKLMQLEAEYIRTSNDVAAVGSRVRREGLTDQVRAQEGVITAIKNQIDILGAEQDIFSANENVIKNATQNEIDYRNRLIAVFKNEALPLTDRIKVGLALIDQLEREGKISKELADQLREQAKQAGSSTGATAALGSAAQGATPHLDTAAVRTGNLGTAAGDAALPVNTAAREVADLAASLMAMAQGGFAAAGAAQQAGGPVGRMGDSAGRAAPQLGAAASQADRMASEAAEVARRAAEASRSVDSLAQSLGRLPSWFTATGTIPLLPPRRAFGGPVQGGSPYIVGERRPELFIPDQDGTILPFVPRSRRGGGGGGEPLESHRIEISIGGRVAEEIFIEGRELAIRRGRVSSEAS